MLISKMGVKMNLRIIRKHYATDPEKEFFTKSISEPIGYSPRTPIPKAWELKMVSSITYGSVIRRAHG